jgi:hypothetical protein
MLLTPDWDAIPACCCRRIEGFRDILALSLEGCRIGCTAAVGARSTAGGTSRLRWEQAKALRAPSHGATGRPARHYCMAWTRPAPHLPHSAGAHETEIIIVALILKILSPWSRSSRVSPRPTVDGLPRRRDERPKLARSTLTWCSATKTLIAQRLPLQLPSAIPHARWRVFPGFAALASSPPPASSPRRGTPSGPPGRCWAVRAGRWAIVGGRRRRRDHALRVRRRVPVFRFFAAGGISSSSDRPLVQLFRSSSGTRPRWWSGP